MRVRSFLNVSELLGSIRGRDGCYRTASQGGSGCPWQFSNKGTAASKCCLRSGVISRRREKVRWWPQNTERWWGKAIRSAFSPWLFSRTIKVWGRFPRKTQDPGIQHTWRKSCRSHGRLAVDLRALQVFWGTLLSKWTLRVQRLLSLDGSCFQVWSLYSKTEEVSVN